MLSLKIIAELASRPTSISCSLQECADKGAVASSTCAESEVRHTQYTRATSAMARVIVHVNSVAHCLFECVMPGSQLRARVGSPFSLV